jgi:hypothetical protein
MDKGAVRCGIMYGKIRTHTDIIEYLLFPDWFISSVFINVLTVTLTETKKLLNELYIFRIRFAKLHIHKFELVG